MTPFVDCVTDAGGTWTAWFGYVNVDSSDVTVPQGAENFFLESPHFRNQPSTFLPGIFHDVFSTTFTGQLTWSLDNEYAVATETATPCAAVDASVTPSAAGAEATYRLAFQAVGADDVQQVTVTAPEGATLPAQASDYTVEGATVDGVATTSAGGSATDNEAVIDLAGAGLAPSTDTTVTISGALNPSSPSAGALITVTLGPSGLTLQGTYASASPELVFTTQPTGAAAGSLLGAQPVVALEDGFNGVVATDSTDSISLTLADPGGAVLSGPVTASLQSGVASFSGLSVNQSGTYTLLATTTAAGVPAVQSAPFTVAAGPGANLAFTTEPGSTVAGTPFTPQPAVVVRDVYGNTVTAGLYAVTLAVTPGTGSPGAALAGGAVTEDTAGGLASFSGLSIALAGTDYTLTATSPGLTTAVSRAFSVTNGTPASVRLTLPASRLSPGGAVTVSGAVYDALGNPVQGATVDLAASAGSIPDTVTTDGDGSFTSQYTAPSSVPAGGGQVTIEADVPNTAVGASATVTVTAGAAAALTLDLSATSVAGGGTVICSGVLSDAQGNPEANVPVSLAVSAGGFGLGGTVAEVVYTNTDGRYSASVTAPGSPGPVTVTASLPGGSLTSEAVLAVLSSSGEALGTSAVFAVTGGITAGGAGTRTPEVSVTASGGGGAASVVQYRVNPVVAAPPDGAATFFDAGLSRGSSFQSVTVQACGLSGPSSAFWWDGTTWRAVSPETYGGGCLFLGPFAASGTSPNLGELGGTPFAVATSLAAGDTLTWSPSPLAASGSLSVGQTVAAAVYATTGGGSPLAGVVVYLSFVPAAAGGSVAVGGTPLTAVPQPFVTDGAGRVQVAYTAPADLPAAGGTDTLMAASGASNPAVAAADTYTFATSAGGGVGGAGGGAGGGGGGGGGGAIAPAPTVTAVQPDSGPTAGGTTVTVTGTGFTGATTVHFGGALAAFSVDSDMRITATAPAGAGTVDVTVTTSSGTSATSTTDTFTYVAARQQRGSAATPTFSDVPPAYWAASDIQALVSAGVLDGFPDGTFRPDAPVSRAQFVKMLDLVLKLPVSASGTGFTDVPASAWFAPYVAAAVRAGIVWGTSPTAFSPNAALTREQMAVMLARALKLTATAPLHFTDGARIDKWALQGVEASVAARYVAGFPDGSFRPEGTATRAQAAKVMAEVIRRRVAVAGAAS